VKTIEETKNQLIKEIESLKDERGLIKAGFPHYNRFFGRDSLIVAWQLLDIDPDNCKRTLEILSELQGKAINDEKEEEPGKILHETDFKRKRHPNSWCRFPYYASVDSTPLYLILFYFYIAKQYKVLPSEARHGSYFYLRKTNDIEFLKKYWQNILAAMNWMEKYGDADGDLFLEYQRKNPKGLYHQGWKDMREDYLKIQPPVAIVEAQGYQYLALKGTAFLAQILKEDNLAKKLLERAKKLKKKFNEKFWMEKDYNPPTASSRSPGGERAPKYFALALDGQKNQKKMITSNPGHLLFTDILEKDKIPLVVKKLFQKDLWTPFGIRTHSIKEPDFSPWAYHRGSVWPHDNWIIAQGLKKLGYQKEYQKIKKATLKAYQDFRFLPECYTVINNVAIENPRACFLQAWASGALLNFLTT